MLKIFVGGSFTQQGNEALERYRHIKKLILSMPIKVQVVNPDDIDDFREDYAKKHPTCTMSDIDNAMVNFDLQYVKNCDIFIADVSNRSTGLGMELGSVYDTNKRILLIAKKDSVISNMVFGAFKQGVKYYNNQNELDEIIKDFFKMENLIWK